MLATVAAGPAAANAIRLPTVSKEIQRQQQLQRSARPIYPNALPCPENGLLPNSPGSPLSLSNCGLPETPATTLPFLGPMAYWGGSVQTQPKEYLVLWGWGQKGAFGSQPCHSEAINEGSTSAALPCDPDGAGKYMADFIHQMNGTPWAGVQSQYFQTDASGHQTYINENGNMLAGVWVDDTHSGDLSKTLATNPAGPTNTYTQLATEATRAAAHFGVKGAALTNANFIIAQPPKFSDPNALNSGYCAFHDFTEPASPGNTYYNYRTVGRHIAYTNMPYTLAITTGGQNDCGANAVNSGARGKLDDFSIALGHEIQETATDPGAEDIVGNVTTGSQTYYGGWYDIADANENGDKCAYVGTPLTEALGLPSVSGLPTTVPIPGAMGNMTGNAGGTFAVQSLWSNASAGGLGYCAGVASSDLPGSLAGEPPYNGQKVAAQGKRAQRAGQRAKRDRARKHRATKRRHTTKQKRHTSTHRAAPRRR
jgi:serine protease